MNLEQLYYHKKKIGQLHLFSSGQHHHLVGYEENKNSIDNQQQQKKTYPYRYPYLICGG